VQKTIPFSEVKNFIDAKLSLVDKLSSVQRKFICNLFITFYTIPFRINFLMMGRFSDYDEKTYRNHFSNGIDFMPFFHQTLVDKKDRELLFAFDPSFIKKSGKKTEGLHTFWDGKSQQSTQGLEVGCLSLIDVEEQTAYHYKAQQTQPSTEKNNLVNQYVKMIIAEKDTMQTLSKYVVADGYFMKQKFIQPLLEAKFEVITKMRSDANLKEIYIAPTTAVKAKGRPKTCGEKIDLKKFDATTWTAIELDKDNEKITAAYEQIVYCVALKKKVKVVVIIPKNTKEKIILLSTDTTLIGSKMIKYYSLRFQIEFLIRDAKQFGGLEDCQARDNKKLNFHFNAALGSISIAKLTMWSNKENKKDVPFSMYNIKQQYHNKFIVDAIFSKLDIDLNCQKIIDIYNQTIDIGNIAA
jgi:hypothetical protein